MDSLSLIYALTYLDNNTVIDEKSFSLYLDNNVKPFIDNVKKTEVYLMQLEVYNCAKVNEYRAHTTLGYLFNIKYWIKLEKLWKEFNYILKFSNVWNSWLMSKMSLTPVWILIANANFRKKTWYNIYLDNYLKE